MGFDHLRTGQISQGYWGEHTSSIDWCEGNYEYSQYIAEFINTISNIPFIILGLYGYHQVLKNGLPSRYGYLMLGLSLIGLGSFGFHMTLQWAWQLMDELPMIYLTSYCAFVVFDTQPGFDLGWSWLALAGTIALDIFITISYVRLPNPIYHQVAFGSLLTCAVGRMTYLVVYRLPPSSEHPAKKIMTKLIVRGLGTFIAAFIVWNLDNIFCDMWRGIRSHIAPFGFVLEGHAFWHLGTGLGCHMVMVAAIYLCLCVKTDVNSYEMRGGPFFPYVARAEKAPLSEKEASIQDASEKTPLLAESPK